MKDQRPKIDVAAGLVFRAGKLLITQRPAGAHLEGLWEFPGGKREPDESFKECLRRELREELGIEIEILQVLGAITHEYPEKTVTLKFFRCALQANEPQALGCPDFRWISAQELAAYQFPDADAALIELLKTSGSLWRDDPA